MKRAIRLSLKFATKRKKVAIATFLQSYRHAVNFFIDSLWDAKGKLDAKTLRRLAPDKTRLSYKQRNAALKQATEIVSSTKKGAIALKVIPSRPIFRGSAILPKELALLQNGEKSFDFIVRISSLKKYHRIIIPTRKTKVFNKWLAKPLAKLIQGCALSENKLIVWVELPDLPFKKEGKILGIDQGMNNLIVTSDGQFLGPNFKKLRDKINRRKRGSKGKRRAFEERRHFIGQQIKKLPWDDISVLGIEELKGIKYGKGKRGKRFRKARIPWVHRVVSDWLEHRADENRVLVAPVSAKNTSRCCPRCGNVSKKNRMGESFCCVSCGHHDHADFVGATNILARTLLFVGSLASPTP